MLLLILVYAFAVGLIAVSVVGAIVLFVIRLIRSWTDARRHRIHDSLVRQMLTALEMPEPPNDLIAALKANPRVAEDVLGELVELIRGVSRERMVAIAQAAGLDDWLRSRLRSQWRAERRTAVEVLRLFSDPATIAALHSALDDRAEDIRLTAALSLAELGQMPRLRELLPRLRIETAERSLLLRRIFLHALTDNIDDVQAVARGSLGLASFRPYAVEALGLSGQLQLVPFLLTLVNEPDANVRVAVMRALGSLAYPGAAPYLESALADPSWEVRAEAIEAVKRTELVSLVPKLVQRLDDEVWWVRFRAGEALSSMGDVGLTALRQISGLVGQRSARIASLVLAEKRQA